MKPRPDASPSGERAPAEPIQRLLTPFREFAQTEASGGVVLLAAAIVGLGWANSPWADTYFALWETDLTVGVGSAAITDSLQHWINDALMAVFFLLVGLEIKRELLVGELASRRRATLPIVAAIGGAIVPAFIYLAIVGGDAEAARGWGIPMATDIAFALGILALVGGRAPLGLRVFLTALAIADDLIAIGVIALFYTASLDVGALTLAGLVVAALAGANALGVRRLVVYGGLGVVLWLAVYASGVHATVAGVLLAMTIPARTRLDPAAFGRRARPLVAEVEGRADDRSDIGERHSALWELEAVTEQAQSPMLRIEHALQGWVAFLVVPLFALANVGVALGAGSIEALGEPVTLAILVGLVVGKQIGITVASYGVVRLGFASLPDGVGWRHIYGAAWLGGIGFTMSLFVATLAFDEGPLLSAAKVGILGASIVAGIGGFLILRRSRAPTH